VIQLVTIKQLHVRQKFSNPE